MSERISWNYVVKALNGPSVSAAGNLEVDAYDKFQITIANTVTQSVELVPAGATVSLLVINPKKPHNALTYNLKGSDTPLDGPHVLIGTGALSLLGDAARLDFTNETGADADIEILIGRDATPET